MHDFHRQLRRIRLLLQGGRAIATVVITAAVITLLWLVFGLLDFAFAFEPAARTAITTALVAVSALVLVALLVRALRLGKREAAIQADARLADPRSPAAAASSLATTKSDTPLGQWLAARSLDEAAATLATLRPARLMPWALWKLSLLLLALLLATTGTLHLAAPEVFATVTSRLLHPRADIPPYSPLRFAGDPEKPVTTYGGEILLTTTITGGTIDHPVECLVRRIGSSEILRLPAFRETPTRHSRKLDGLTQPVEIAFAVGKARSKWTPVEILLEPRILAGQVHITPPAYTGIKTTSFPLDTNEISAVEGSSITLELTSNRPLASGTLTLTPATGGDATPGRHTATTPSQHTAAFTWTATRSGGIHATVSDLRGTPCAEPLTLGFRAVPDQPPAVDLLSPPRFLLATPTSTVPVEGDARDDFGLARLQVVRTLAGFRDRVRVVAPAIHGKSYEFTDTLDLYDLGLEAGQIIEIMLESSDHNPSLLGHGSSEISRIKIISEDEYAAYIRAKTTIAEFSARFRAARQAIDEARKALVEMQNADTPDDAESARQAAIQAHQEAAGLMDEIADDFPAFELEDRLQDLARRQADTLRENLRELDRKQPDIPEMLDRLGQHEREHRQLDGDAQLARDTARILEMAAKFREIYENQVSVTKRFGRIVKDLMRGEARNRRQLPALAETQQKNREALDQFKTDLKKRIEELTDVDPSLNPLIDSAARFLQELETAEPETLMDAATTHGKAGQATEAHTNAEHARALLERLLNQPEPFPQAAKGQAPELDVPNPDVNDNIAQMLDAMLGRIAPGDGQPGGQGQGPGGFGPPGGPASGYGIDLPVIGPDRLRFDPLSPSGGGGGDGRRNGPTPPLPDSAEAGTLDTPATRHGEASTLSPESIPESYRDAVKRYFTP